MSAFSRILYLLSVGRIRCPLATRRTSHTLFSCVMVDDRNSDERRCIDETPIYQKKEDLLVVKDSTPSKTWVWDIRVEALVTELFIVETGDVRSRDGRSVINKKCM